MGQCTFQYLLEIFPQGAADAPCVQVFNLNGIAFEKGFVDLHPTKVVLNDKHSLVPQSGLQKMLDEGGFSGTQKAGDHKDLCHGASFLSQ